MRGIINTDRLYRHTPISKNESLSMRGVAILCIAIHNLLHLLIFTHENEYVLHLSHTEGFVANIAARPAWALADTLSFLGWYGVAIFLFLSGYGLVRKHENMRAQYISIPYFVTNSYLKLFKLMLLPLFILALLRLYLYHEPYPVDMFFYMLELVANITHYDTYLLSIYWYFGLTFELYVLYRLCIYRRSINWIIALNIMAVALFAYLCSQNDLVNMSFARHNFAGWILPFTVGVALARYDLSSLFQNKRLNIAIVLLAGPILTLMNYDPYLWYISPVVAIIAAVALAKVWQVGMWIGAISSFIFVAHPIVRQFMIHKPALDAFGFKASDPYSIEIIPIIALFLALTLILAHTLKWLHRHLYE